MSTQSLAVTVGRVNYQRATGAISQQVWAIVMENICDLVREYNFSWTEINSLIPSHDFYINQEVAVSA
jgi:hypothetical protein